MTDDRETRGLTRRHVTETGRGKTTDCGSQGWTEREHTTPAMSSVEHEATDAEGDATSGVEHEATDAEGDATSGVEHEATGAEGDATSSVEHDTSNVDRDATSIADHSVKGATGPGAARSTAAVAKRCADEDVTSVERSAGAKRCVDEDRTSACTLGGCGSADSTCRFERSGRAESACSYGAPKYDAGIVPGEVHGAPISGTQAGAREDAGGRAPGHISVHSCRCCTSRADASGARNRGAEGGEMA